MSESRWAEPLEDYGSYYRTYINNRVVRSITGAPPLTPEQDRAARDRALQRDAEEGNSPLGPYTPADLAPSDLPD